MQVKVIMGLAADTEVEDEINDALAEGWDLRDTHVAVPDQNEGNVVGIWLVAILVRSD